MSVNLIAGGKDSVTLEGQCRAMTEIPDLIRFLGASGTRQVAPDPAASGDDTDTLSCSTSGCHDYTEMPADKSEAILYYKNHFIHKPAISSPENPERISQVMGFLKGRTDIFPNKATMMSEFPPA